MNRYIKDMVKLKNNQTNKTMMEIKIQTTTITIIITTITKINIPKKIKNINQKEENMNWKINQNLKLKNQFKKEIEINLIRMVYGQNLLPNQLIKAEKNFNT